MREDHRRPAGQARWSRRATWRTRPRRCAPAAAAPWPKADDGTAAAGPRGAAVKGEEGYAAAGRRGAVVSGEEGYAAVGRNGNVVTGEEVDVQGGAVGRRGAVVVGEEGAAAVGRYGGVVVGDRYESYDAWKAVAAVGAGIAIGTMLAKPPAAATTVVVSGSTYYYHDNAYYTRVMTGGDVAYQVVEPPAGAIITTLPAGCKSVTRQQRAVHAVRHDVLHESGDGLSSGRPAVSDDARTAIARRVARPASGVAAGRRGRRPGDARHDRRVEPVEGRRFRHVLHHRRRWTALRAGIRERRGAIGGDRASHRRSRMPRGVPRCCRATPSSRGSRAGSSIASAGIDVRWTRSASRPGASSTRGTPWRRLPV